MLCILPFLLQCLQLVLVTSQLLLDARELFLARMELELELLVVLLCVLLKLLLLVLQLSLQCLQLVLVCSQLLSDARELLLPGKELELELLVVVLFFLLMLFLLLLLFVLMLLKSLLVLLLLLFMLMTEMADKFLQIHGLVVLVFTLCSVCIHLLLQPHAWSSHAHSTSSSSPLTLHVLRKKGGVQAKQRPGEPGVWRHRRLAASLSPPWPVAANRRVTASVTPTTRFSTRILPTTESCI